MALIKKINIKGTEYDICASQLGNSLKVGEGENSTIIDEGKALGKTSIAGGTTDKTILDGLLGGLTGTAAALALKESEAKGAMSISLGANNRSNTGGSIALGYDNVSGGKGYYVTAINTTDKTITLSTKQTSTSSPGNPSWNAGDKLFFVNDDRYWLEVAAKTSSNVVTVVDMPFTSLVSVNSLTSKPNERAIINVTQPESGTVDIGWGAIGIGTQNIVVGSNAYTVGYKNTVVGDFGAAFGQENTVGYSSFVTGIKNKATGKASFVSGQNNICTGNEALVSGGEENTVKVNRSIVTGSNHNVEGGPYNAVFGLGNKIETLSEGHELVAGWDNTLSAGGFGAILGVRGKNVSGNQNLILGRDNTNTAGARNVISGDVNEVVSGNQNIITGKTNKVTGSNNNVSGESNTNASGHQNIIGGYLNTNNGRNNLIAGESNNITSESSNDNIVAGYGNTLSGSNNILQGESNIFSGSRSLIHGCGNSLSCNFQKNGIYVLGNYNSSADSIEGLELIVGNDNRIDAGGYGAIFGSRNTNTAGNQNLISGADNNCNGTRNIVGGAHNVLLDNARRNFITGEYNSIAGSDNNLVVGNHNSLNTTSNCNNIICGEGNVGATLTRNALVCGKYAKVSDSTRFAVGNGSDANNTSNIIFADESDVNITASNMLKIDAAEVKIDTSDKITIGDNKDCYISIGPHDSSYYGTITANSNEGILNFPAFSAEFDDITCNKIDRPVYNLVLDGNYFDVRSVYGNRLYILELEQSSGKRYYSTPFIYSSDGVISLNCIFSNVAPDYSGFAYLSYARISNGRLIIYGYEDSQCPKNEAPSDLSSYLNMDTLSARLRAI